MIANVAILLFLIGMGYWWGFVQGLFSAFLHLIATIVAGALAFAFWELLATGFLLNTMPSYAWGVSLIAPFILLLILLRTGLDKLIPKNMQFPQVANMVGGAACGTASGVLTSGLVVLGLAQLPMSSVGEYQPFTITDGGDVGPAKDGVTLWIPVDSLAGAFFQRLSNGAFYSGEPMALFLPGLRDHAFTSQLKVDPNASAVAIPGSVELGEKLYLHKFPLPGLHPAAATAIRASEGKQIVVVDTRWKSTLATFDKDSTVRIPPSQIRLIAWSTTENIEAHIASPSAWSIPQTGATRHLSEPTQKTPQAIGQSDTAVNWVFVIPADFEPAFVLARGLRLDLANTQLSAKPAEVVAAIGLPAGVSASPTPPTPTPNPNTNPSTGTNPSVTPGPSVKIADEVRAFAELPIAVSKNHLSSFSLQGDQIFSGNGKIANRNIVISPKNRVNQVYAPSHQSIIRVKFFAQQAYETFGQVASGETRRLELSVGTQDGARHPCIGYAHLNAKDRDLIMNFTRPDSIKSGAQLPIDDLNGQDELHLYFVVPQGSTVVSFNAGGKSQTGKIVPGTDATYFK